MQQAETIERICWHIAIYVYVRNLFFFTQLASCRGVLENFKAILRGILIHTPFCEFYFYKGEGYATAIIFDRAVIGALPKMSHSAVCLFNAFYTSTMSSAMFYILIWKSFQHQTIDIFLTCLVLIEWFRTSTIYLFISFQRPSFQHRLIEIFFVRVYPQ